jgi:hypothetical protein
VPSSTTNFGLLQPLVNNPTDQDLWGGFLNQNIDDDDVLLLTAMTNKTVVETASFSVAGRTAGTSATGNSRNLFLCNCTSAAVTASLPAANSVDNGFIVAFKKEDGSANALTIAPAGSDTIDGAPTLAVSAQYDSFVLVSDGVSNWNIMSYKHGISNALLIPNNLSDVANPATALSNLGGLAASAFTGSNQSLASPGYQKFPGGLILQWGTIAPSVLSATFPVPFPNACLLVVPSAQWNAFGAPNSNATYVASTSTTGWSRATADSNVGLNYLAVGF